MESKRKSKAQDIIDNHLYSFETVIEYFQPNNITQKEFEKYIEKMKDPKGKYETT